MHKPCAVSIKLVSLFRLCYLGLIWYFEPKTTIINFAKIAKSESHYLETALVKKERFGLGSNLLLLCLGSIFQLLKSTLCALVMSVAMKQSQLLQQAHSHLFVSNNIYL